jgi:hypothetical protein
MMRHLHLLFQPPAPSWQCTWIEYTHSTMLDACGESLCVSLPTLAGSVLQTRLEGAVLTCMCVATNA